MFGSSIKVTEGAHEFDETGKSKMTVSCFFFFFQEHIPNVNRRVTVYY